jgi:hypothetical protein
LGSDETREYRQQGKAGTHAPIYTDSGRGNSSITGGLGTGGAR